MFLSPDDIIHQNTGGTSTSNTSTPIAVSLLGGETTDSADSTVVVALFGSDNTFAVTTPSGWSRAISALGGTPEIFYRGPDEGMTPGESSWNFTPSTTGGGPVTWLVLDLQYVNPSDLTTVGGAARGTVTSGTTATATSVSINRYDYMVLAFHGAVNSADVTPSTWDSHTNGFVEVVEAAQAGSVKSVSLSVSALSNQATPLVTKSCTATLNRTITSADYAGWSIVALMASGSKSVPITHYVDGAEHGLITGNTLGPSNLKILETVTAGVTVDAAAARTGGHGWKLTSTTAACNFTQSNYFSGTAQPWPVVNRRHFRFPTLPASGQNPELLTLTTSGSTNIVLRYIGSSGLLGLKVGAGAEVLSDQTITADQWFGVDIDCDLSDTAAYAVRWAVDYNAEATDNTPATEQTAGTGSGTGTSLGNAGYRVGWATASTATCYTDDAAGMTARSQYPIGDVRVLGLKVDPAGTPTISDGVTTNFGVMTANGTVAAWNAVNARNAIDDVPPNLDGTRDAAVCLLASASAHAEFPAETVDLATLRLNPVGWRADACLWAASATASTIRLTVTDGAEVYTITGEVDPNADSAATPVWVGRRLIPATNKVITQVLVDGLAYRIGSNDPNPDVGIDCFVISVACVKAVPEVLFGEPGGPVYVEASRDPATNGLVGFTVTTVGSPATVDYEVDGTPDSTGLIAADTSHYEAIPSGGESFPTVNKITLIPG